MADSYSLGPFIQEDSLMPTKKLQDMSPLMTLLGHDFARPALLRDALIHPSLSRSGKAGGKASSAYERLEFLGDRVLGLVIAHWLYELYPDEAEGALAKRHASLVNRDVLKKVAQAMELDRFLCLAKGESVNEERKNLAALSDATEAVIGALYLDGGMAPAEKLIKKYWKDMIEVDHAPADPKTALQEYAQGHRLSLPIYREIKRTGPSHAPHFIIEVSLSGFDPVSAEGASKREAEKTAATLLLREINKK